MKRFLLLVIIIGFLGCKDSKTSKEANVITDSKLIEVFKASNSNYPNISVHRGGKALKNYPENCLETLQYVNDSISAIYEIDVAQTKDGQLVLMHDNSIDRTTNGTGLVKDLTYNELKNFNLVDDYENVDISMTYITPADMGDIKSTVTIAAAVTNIGAKISYTQSANRDFLPGNLGIGAAWDIDFDEFNRFTVAFDLNKLLVPTPKYPEDPNYDIDPQDGIADHRQKSLFSGVFGSFADAPNGFSEEMQEIMYSIGLEYWYDKQFAVRAGYYYESPTKGNRQFVTAGIGLKYNIFGLNLSYLIPTSNQRSPLDNTLRFSLIFNFGDKADTGVVE